MGIRFEVVNSEKPNGDVPVRAELVVDDEGDLTLSLNGESLLYIGANNGKLYRFSTLKSELEDMGLATEQEADDDDEEYAVIAVGY